MKDKTMSGEFKTDSHFESMLAIAIEEANLGFHEGGVPVGAALFECGGKLIGRGHNRRVQHGDPCTHGETDAVRNAGRRRSYRDTILATTLAPCWFCSGLIVQFKIPVVVVGSSSGFRGGMDWLDENGVSIIELKSVACDAIIETFKRIDLPTWLEDIGEAGGYLDPNHDILIRMRKCPYVDDLQ